MYINTPHYKHTRAFYESNFYIPISFLNFDIWKDNIRHKTIQNELTGTNITAATQTVGSSNNRELRDLDYLMETAEFKIIFNDRVIQTYSIVKLLWKKHLSKTHLLEM